MNTYRLKILMPEKKLYDGEIISATVPGAGGLLTILAGHEAMVALLGQGTLIIRTAEKTLKGETGPGLLEVSRNEAVIMIRSFIWVHENGEKSETLQNTNQMLP